MLYPRNNNFRTVKDLSGFWKFKVDENKVGEKEKWYSGNYGSARDIAVPGSWNEQYQDIRDYLGTAWYFKEVFLPRGWKEKRIWLRIGEASYLAKVWVNGKYLGRHEGGHLPFQFDISNRVKFGEKNLISLSVNKGLTRDTNPQGGLVSSEDSPMFLNDQFPNVIVDYFPYAGIHRPVLLYTTPRDYIEDLSLVTNIQEKKGFIDYWVKTRRKTGGNIEVFLTDGKRNLTGTATIKGGIAEGRITVDRAVFWYPENPFLYQVTVKLRRQEVIDEYSLPVGIRTIKVRGNKLLLNGKPVFLKGFGKHEDFPVLGKGLSYPLIVKDYSLLKWVNANSFRTSHYPYSEEMMDMADKKGYLVIDEIPASQFDRSILGNPRVLSLCKRFLKELVERDKNRPSVIMWVVANEPDSKSREAKPFLKELYRYARQLDKTRPVSFVSCITTDFNEFKGNDLGADFSDIICLNRYFGWYSQPGQIELACQYLSRDLDEVYKRYKKPIMITEFGADTIAGMHSDPPELFTEEYQLEFLNAYCRVIESKPYIVGEHIWNFADFKTSQHYYRVIFNRKGVFTRERQPKMAAHMLRKRWAKSNAVMEEPTDAKNEKAKG